MRVHSAPTSESKPGRRPAPGRGAFLAAAVAAACTLLALPVTGVALASTHLAQAVRVQPPANAAKPSTALLYAVACARTGSCVAGGSYVDNASRSQAMVVGSASGKWAAAHELAMPAGADPDPRGMVTAIDCTGLGSCVAAGDYRAGNDTRDQGFVVTETNGKWGPARRIIPPLNSAASSSFTLHGISCPSAGNCVAVGSYTDASRHQQVMAASESTGKWSRAREIMMPTNAAASPAADGTSVACAKAGACVATADYGTASGAAQVATATLSAGKWHQAVELRMPTGAAANPQAQLLSVTCTAVGSCVAVGQYENAGFANLSFTAKESAGSWHRASTFTVVPSNAAPHPQVELRSVTCLKTGSCVAVGGYLDKAGGGASLAAVMLSGKWTAAGEISPPKNALSGGVLSTQVTSVSCTSGGYCAAVGYYENTGSQWNAMAATTP